MTTPTVHATVSIQPSKSEDATTACLSDLYATVSAGAPANVQLAHVYCAIRSYTQHILAVDCLFGKRKCIMESWGLFGSVWVVIEGIWSDLLYGMSSMWKLRSQRATCEDDGNGYLGKQSFTFGLSCS
ncbi:MAG: hypothetical protein CL912_13660 [Deltaproteobacteria bacterium]|nr:hypothetical protein [Deltaproteobacteria bacterium]